MMMVRPHFLTLREASTLLDKSDSSIRELRRRGEIRAHVFGKRSIRISLLEIWRYMRKNKIDPHDCNCPCCSRPWPTEEEWRALDE